MTWDDIARAWGFQDWADFRLFEGNGLYSAVRLGDGASVAVDRQTKAVCGTLDEVRPLLQDNQTPREHTK